MPVLNLTDLQDDPEVTRLKILALMLYPFNRSPYGLLLENIAKSATTHEYEFDQIEQREYLTLVQPPDYSHQSRWDIACQQYAEDQRGCTAGWLLLTAERLQTAGDPEDTVSKAAFLFKSLWEQHHPGQMQHRNAVRKAWQDYQSVAHLWAAGLVSVGLSGDEFWRRRRIGQLPLSFLEEDLLAFLARAMFFRRCGVTHRTLSSEDTWTVPKDFLLPAVEVDLLPLTDEEQDALAEYPDDAPQSESTVKPQQVDRSSSDFVHAPDFRSVCLRGQQFSLTPQQAHVIQILYELYKNRTPEVGQHYILAEMGISSSRLRDTFRDSLAWDTLIVAGNTKGTLRLNL